MKLSKAAASGGVQSAHHPSDATPIRFRLLSGLDRWCLFFIGRQLRRARWQIRLWDGTTAVPDATPVGTVTILDRVTLWRLVTQPELAFGEAYADGNIQVAGDLTQMIESLNLSLSAARPRHRALRAALGRRTAGATPAAARANVHQHYDLGNEFYRLWLDDAMVYTCAYFDAPDIGLEEAQRAKLDYVCRKLNLRPGEHVIEAGCGWGALAMHMAEHYEVTVHAYNISEEQLRYARRQADARGLSDRITFIDGDFRSIVGTCDAFISVGMLEHVGLGAYETFGEVIDRVLDPSHGRGLLHFIGRNHPKEFDDWTRRHIFPGAYAPALSEVCGRLLEPWHLSVFDVENLRRHYASTLSHWRQRFERRSPEVGQMFDDRFVRMWRLYLASAEASFTSGDLQLFQLTFGRATDNTWRLTRSDLYSPSPRCAPGADHGHM